MLEGHVQVYGTLSYSAFLVPGLVMMSVLQNAFANSSSSLVQSKIMGSLVFVLLTPLSHWAWFGAYVGAAVLRGLVVGLGVYLVTLFLPRRIFAAPLWVCWSLRCWARRCWDAGPDCRAVGRQVRPDGGLSELHHRAHDVSRACSIRFTRCRRFGSR